MYIDRTEELIDSLIGSLKWHERFLDLSKHVAGWSKDPSTKVGAIIAKGKEIVSLGYNGFPSNVRDAPELINDRPEKHKRVIHAEMNAILRANGNTQQKFMYVSTKPCLECTKMIIASGISLCFYYEPDDGLKERFKDSFAASDQLAKEAERYWQGNLNDWQELREQHRKWYKDGSPIPL